MSTEAISGTVATQSTANSSAGTNAEGGSTTTAAPQGGSKDAGQQTVKTYTQAEVDAQAATLRKKHEAEISALKNQGKPAEERLLEAEKRLKELEPLAEIGERLSKELSNEVQTRFGQLPETHRPSEAILKALPLSEQRALLAQFEKVAGTANVGAIQSPGGNVGNRTTGIDVAAIAEGVDRLDTRLYNEALKTLGSEELSKRLAEYRAKKR